MARPRLEGRFAFGPLRVSPQARVVRKCDGATPPPVRRADRLLAPRRRSRVRRKPSGGCLQDVERRRGVRPQRAHQRSRRRVVSRHRRHLPARRVLRARLLQGQPTGGHLQCLPRVQARRPLPDRDLRADRRWRASPSERWGRSSCIGRKQERLHRGRYSLMGRLAVAAAAGLDQPPPLATVA